MHICVIGLIVAASFCRVAARGANHAQHKHSIEDVAAAIADPRSPKFRQFLTAAQASELSEQLPFPQLLFNASTIKRDTARASPGERRHFVSPAPAVNHIRDALCAAEDLVTPTCIGQVYNVDYTPQPSKVTFGVYATEGASFNPDDLTDFLRQYRPDAQDLSYQVIANGDPSEQSGIEAQFEVALDTQTLFGTAAPAAAILYNLGGVFGPDSGKSYRPFVDFLYGLIHNETVPSVVSFSQSLSEDKMDPDYARTLCTMMALVGARGVSLLFSSGNNGPNGDEAGGTHNTVFEPKFPASCPWVTAVGGTVNLQNETAATDSTIPASNKAFYAASGGGFSNLFTRPRYQQHPIDSYVTKHIPDSYRSVSGFNASGRGMPDVSAFSANIPTVVNGVTFPIGGTSASTPLWAAIVTLLNDYEASKGRPHLGFLNPWLYSLASNTSTPAPLHDIVTGGNSKGACNLVAGCRLNETLGYDVTEGWDPVTGLGSPFFSSLISALDTAAAEDCK